MEVGTERSKVQYSTSKLGQELLYHMAVLATNFELDGFRKNKKRLMAVSMGMVRMAKSQARKNRSESSDLFKDYLALYLYEAV